MPTLQFFCGNAKHRLAIGGRYYDMLIRRSSHERHWRHGKNHAHLRIELPQANEERAKVLYRFADSEIDELMRLRIECPGDGPRTSRINSAVGSRSPGFRQTEREDEYVAGAKRI